MRRRFWRIILIHMLSLMFEWHQIVWSKQRELRWLKTSCFTYASTVIVYMLQETHLEPLFQLKNDSAVTKPCNWVATFATMNKSPDKKNSLHLRWPACICNSITITTYKTGIYDPTVVVTCDMIACWHLNVIITLFASDLNYSNRRHWYFKADVTVVL